jgi:hypothetical protein
MSGVKWSSMSEPELADLFRQLGAQNPKGWARSQIREGIPQLARYLFLRQAWRLVVGPNDRNWISRTNSTDRIEPGDGTAQALDRLIGVGAPVEDLTTVVRVMQWHLLAGLTIFLDQPWDLDDEITDDDIWWGLFLVDENGHPTEPLDALIESVLETDPTGQEMRPVEYFRNSDARDPDGRPGLTR